MDISIIVPAIRTHLWERLYNSLELSLPSHSWELLIGSPFDLPDSLAEKENIVYLKTYDRVGVVIQKLSLLASGDLVAHGVDDAIYVSGALSRACDFCHETCDSHDVVGLTYVENTNNMTSADKWAVKNLPEFRDLKYVDVNWSVCVQPLMSLDYFKFLGGFDCRFLYSNHSHIDLSFRACKAGGSIKFPPFTVSYADHMPERSGDHGPIHDAQTLIDEPAFNQLWNKPRRAIIDYDNYKQFEGPWKRFSKEYSSYTDMCEGEGYKIK
jgi:hypothetical protein